MPRYVDARGIILAVQRGLIPNLEDDGMVNAADAERYFIRIVDKAPTADVVEKGRCVDCSCCEEYSNGAVLYCAHWGKNTDRDGFCHEYC